MALTVEVDRNSQWSKALVGDLYRLIAAIKGELLSEYKTVLCQLGKAYGLKRPRYRLFVNSSGYRSITLHALVGTVDCWQKSSDKNGVLTISCLLLSHC